MWRFAIIIFLALSPPGFAQEKEIGLFAPDILKENGFLQFLLPRFSLKTGIRVVPGPMDDADIRLSREGDGTVLMQGLGATFSVSLVDESNPMAVRFFDWLLSDIGQRTIAQFRLNDAQVFTLIAAAAPDKPNVIFEGDIVAGEALSFTNCGRCHVIGPRNRTQGIGSTPSFGVLRSLPDWQERFATFYARRPHPAISQIEGLTEPFDPAHPPTTYPLVLTVDEFNDILAYVATIPAADLGAPLVVHQ